MTTEKPRGATWPAHAQQLGRVVEFRGTATEFRAAYDSAAADLLLLTTALRGLSGCRIDLAAPADYVPPTSVMLGMLAGALGRP